MEKESNVDASDAVGLAYVVTEAAETATEWGTMCTYGIKGVNAQGENLVVINDISGDYDQLAALVGRCNRAQLSPIHLSDVIEDFFGSL